MRIAGKDPYDNAVAFAKFNDPATGFGWGITTPGHNFSFVNWKRDLAFCCSTRSYRFDVGNRIEIRKWNGFYAWDESLISD